LNIIQVLNQVPHTVISFETGHFLGHLIALHDSLVPFPFIPLQFQAHHVDQIALKLATVPYAHKPFDVPVILA
jgi:hypothetical protein